MTIVLYQNAESEENVNYVTLEIGSHIELMAAKLSGRSRDRLYPVWKNVVFRALNFSIINCKTVINLLDFFLKK